MFKIETIYRNTLKVEIFKLKAAEKNIFDGIKKARNQTIADMKEYLDDDSLYAYPHEHSPENRLSSSQVRTKHGSEHFKFIKATVPSGQRIRYDVVMTPVPDDPDGVGNILLTGARPHSYQPSEAEFFSYRRRGDSWKVRNTNHPGHPSYAEFFNAYLELAGKTNYKEAITQLVASGNGIFKPGMFKTALEVQAVGESGVYGTSAGDRGRFPYGMYPTGGE